MNRKELGSRLLEWHGSMSDPIYAVGSFYFDDKMYPTSEVVKQALSKLEELYAENQRMLAGQKVLVERNGQLVDLKVFAGYTTEILESNIWDLEAIIPALKQYLEQDYMKTWTPTQMNENINKINKVIPRGDWQYEKTHGQLVLYTGIFKWEDGSFHNVPDPKKKDD